MRLKSVGLQMHLITQMTRHVGQFLVLGTGFKPNHFEGNKPDEKMEQDARTALAIPDDVVPHWYAFEDRVHYD
jgi:hypothetical protein